MNEGELLDPASLHSQAVRAPSTHHTLGAIIEPVSGPLERNRSVEPRASDISENPSVVYAWAEYR